METKQSGSSKESLAMPAVVSASSLPTEYDEKLSESSYSGAEITDKKEQEEVEERLEEQPVAAEPLKAAGRPPGPPPPPLMDLDAGIVGWDSFDDPANPKNWPVARKWRTMVFVAFSTFILPLASTLFAPGVELVAEEFDVTSSTIEALMVSIFVFGFGWGPMLFHAPLCELYGRKKVISVSNLLFAIFNIGCALAQNVGTFFACRFLGGLLGCASMVVGGGVISDMFTRENMGRASSVYAMGPLMGPVIGPVIGGFIAQDLGWRWAFRFLIIVGFVSFCLFTIAVQETHPPTILRQKTKRLQKELNRPDLESAMDKDNKRTPVMVFVFGFTRPLALLFTNPTALCLGLYMAIAFAYLYVFLTTLTEVFHNLYGFSTGLTGLAYLGLGVGLQTALFTVGWTNDKLVAWLTKRNNGVREPEFRLRPLLFSCICFPVAMFWYGWSVQTHAHWFAVIASMFPLGLGMVSSMLPIQTYLIEVFAPYGLSASAVAAGNCFRMTAGAFFPLVAPPLFARLDYGWGCSLLGFLALGMLASMAIAFIYFGKHLRLKYPPKV
ncbi:major facilitator superfamily domain-containing protein [Limtongia smithiae]|uniref:major facilitator superfamily domain-containing protein n=1 Tax=Limtongia smithiae TaxID=1125753 RepID=UPI0034CDF9BB